MDQVKNVGVVTPGTIWWSGDGKKFIVNDMTTDDDYQTWVHYELVGSTPVQTYNCLIESFVNRFLEIPK